MTTTDHAIVAPAVTGDPGTRDDAGGANHRDRSSPYHRAIDGRPAAPDPIPQPEGDAPPAPAQSAGAAADGEDDAVALLDAWRAFGPTTREGTGDMRAACKAYLARRGARPHEPADAPARPERGEVAEAVLAEREAEAACAVAASNEHRTLPDAAVRSWAYYELPTFKSHVGAELKASVQLRHAYMTGFMASEAAIRSRPTPAVVLDRARPAGQGEGEPVAWQWRFKAQANGWVIASEAICREMAEEDNIEFRPIYAAPPAPASRATSAPVQDAAPAGVTEAEVDEALKAFLEAVTSPTDYLKDILRKSLEAAARARTPDAGKETGR